MGLGAEPRVFINSLNLEPEFNELIKIRVEKTKETWNICDSVAGKFSISKFLQFLFFAKILTKISKNL